VGNESDLPTLPSTASEDGERDDANYGRFVSLGVIGQGGMGVVLRAHDPELDRNVAIKVLAPALFGAYDPTSEQRLQREAQAMAKLSHPNVVHVYEMGRAGSSRFIAMELVEGSTLRRWLADRTRSWRDVVAAFIACGRGLEAAHDAGLVHRDFKPENVLIGADQRPRVTDFGLVATGVTFDSADLGDASPISGLTVRGAIIGTPMYMSPEQWAGGDVDERTDQFAFCVALWEGVYGERPFAGRTSAEVRDNVLAGKLRETPDVKGVPRWLEAALRRGLAVNRDDRWPSMTSLLAELDRPRGRRWPWLVAAAGVLGAGALAVALVIGPSGAPDPCPDPRARLAGVGDASVAERMKSAFIAASPGIGDEMSARVAPALDTYAADWREGVMAACRATRMEGGQSSQLLDARMVCLDRRRNELAALTAAFLAADRARVTRAVDAVGGLGDLAACADRERLLAAPPPSDPSLRKRVEEVDLQIVESRALQFADRVGERQAHAEAALAAARTVDHLPLLVRALEEMADAAYVNSDQAAAGAALRELAQKASEARDDRLAAAAWVDLLKLLSDSHGRTEAATLEPVAVAAVARAGSPPRLKFELRAAIGVRLMHAQELDASIAAFREAVDLADTEAGRSVASQALAQVINMRDGPRAALPVAEEALKVTEHLYGPNHPVTADAVYVVAQLQLDARDLERAFPLANRALAIRERALEPGNREIAAALHQIANIERLRGNVAQARDLYLRAISILETARGTQDAALAHGMLAGLLADNEGMDAARPHYEAALAGLAATFGKDHIHYLHMEANFGQRLLDAGLCSEAVPYFDHSAEGLARVMPRDVPSVLEQAGLCEATQGKWDAAIAKLEQARAACTKYECDFPEDLAFDLGRVLVESRRDRAGGLKLVDEAQRLATKHESTELLGQIAAWRAARR
jgi:tetratricopeptide (TPR) repeat protein